MYFFPACDKISKISLGMATDHIIGGKNAEQDEFPHMVSHFRFT